MVMVLVYGHSSGDSNLHQRNVAMLFSFQNDKAGENVLLHDLRMGFDF